MKRRCTLTWLFCALTLTACSPDEEDNTGASDGATPPSDAATPTDADAMTQGLDAMTAAQDAGTDAGQDPAPARPFQGSGISGNVDGTVVTYSKFTLFPNNSGDGRLMMEASASNLLSKWRIFVPGTPGSYECDDAGDTTVVQLIGTGGGSVGSEMGSCTVTVTTASDGIVAGTFVARLQDGSGGLKAVTDGHFYHDMYGGPTDEDGLAAGEQGASFEIEGKRYTYALASPLAYETFAGIAARPMEQNAPGFPLGVQIHSVTNAAGSYRCGEGPSYRALNVWFYWKGAFYRAGSRQSAEPAGPAGSSCTVEVTTVGTIDGSTYSGTFEGTFSGTFVKDDGAALTVTNGSFRVTMQ